LSFGIGAQSTGGQLVVVEFDFALLVVDNGQGGVSENVGIAAARFRVSPAHDV
jgi:hypothetical protein